MSGAAKINERLKMSDMPVYEPPTTLHVNLKKHPGMDADDVGKKVHFHGHGVIRSIRKDEHEHRMEIDVKKVKRGAPPQMEDHD